MNKAKIRIVYRQEIDHSSAGGFEKALFQASYEEFLLKSRSYDKEGKFKTFSNIRANDTRANSLNYKLGFAVGHIIAQLNNKMPLVKDNLGNKIAFDIANFELIESHTGNISLHQVAINYQTGLLSLMEIMGEYLLLAQDNLSENNLLETFVLRMQPSLSIVSYQQASHPQIILSAQ